MTDGAHAAIDILRDIFFRNRDEVFLIDVGTGKEFKYRDVERISKKIASFLLRLGVVKMIFGFASARIDVISSARSR